MIFLISKQDLYCRIKWFPGPFLGPQSKTGSESENNKQSGSSQFVLIDDMEVSFNIPKYNIRLEDPTVRSGKEKSNKMSVVESQVESPFSLPECKEVSQSLMLKALGSLMLRQGIDSVESKQVMEVMAELTIQFLGFFWRISSKRIRYSGKSGK